MSYDRERHHRRSIRLPMHDYAQPGAYFVTLVTRDRLLLFGKVLDGEMILNSSGLIAKEEWFKTAYLRPYVTLAAEEVVIMPNHIHGIVWIKGSGLQVGAQRRCAPTDTLSPRSVEPCSLSAIVRAFKAATCRRINTTHGTPRASVWQRNYYEHIIRDDESLRRIRQYILRNPLHWQTDRENPGACIEPCTSSAPWET